MKLKNVVRKGLATSLSATLVITQVVFAHAIETNFWKERKKQVQLAQLPALDAIPVQPQLNIQSQVLNPQLKALAKNSQNQELKDTLSALSLQYGSIRQVNIPRNRKSDGVIIHIQDVHKNTEAQANISNAVAELINKGKVDVMGLEGAFDTIDLSGIRSYRNQEAVKIVADYLLREHKISGPIYAAYTSKKAIPFLVGIDDKKAYNANVQAYLDSSLLIKEKKEQLAAIKNQLALNKAATYNKNLMAFDQAVESYRKGDLNLADYLAHLKKSSPSLTPDVKEFAKAVDMEASIDFDRVERERTNLINKLVKTLSKKETEALLETTLAFRMGQIRHTDFYKHIQKLCKKNNIALSNYKAMQTYVQYVLLTDSLDFDAVLDQVNEIEITAYKSLARSNLEKDLVMQSKQAYLMGQLVDFALTPTEWEDYKALTPAPLPQAGEGMSLASFESFYLEAEKRDIEITKNLLDAMDNQKAKVAVLVTGGFHTPGITKKLTEAGLASVSYAPKITQIDEHEESYLSVFSQEKTPLEKLFEGEKLFLADNPGSILPFPSVAVSGVNQALNPNVDVPTAQETEDVKAMAGDQASEVQEVDVKPTQKGFEAYVIRANGERVKVIGEIDPDTDPDGAPQLKKIEQSEVGKSWLGKTAAKAWGPFKEQFIFIPVSVTATMTASLLVFLGGIDLAGSLALAAAVNGVLGWLTHKLWKKIFVGIHTKEDYEEVIRIRASFTRNTIISERSAYPESRYREDLRKAGEAFFALTQISFIGLSLVVALSVYLFDVSVNSFGLGFIISLPLIASFVFPYILHRFNNYLFRKGHFLARSGIGSVLASASSDDLGKQVSKIFQEAKGLDRRPPIVITADTETRRVADTIKIGTANGKSVIGIESRTAKSYVRFKGKEALEAQEAALIRAVESKILSLLSPKKTESSTVQQPPEEAKIEERKGPKGPSRGRAPSRTRPQQAPEEPTQPSVTKTTDSDDRLPKAKSARESSKSKQQASGGSSFWKIFIVVVTMGLFALGFFAINKFGDNGKGGGTGPVVQLPKDKDKDSDPNKDKVTPPVKDKGTTPSKDKGTTPTKDKDTIPSKDKKPPKDGGTKPPVTKPGELKPVAAQGYNSIKLQEHKSGAYVLEFTFPDGQRAILSGMPGINYQPVPDDMKIQDFGNSGDYLGLYKALLDPNGADIDEKKYPNLKALVKKVGGAKPQDHAEKLAETNMRLARTYNIVAMAEEQIDVFVELMNWADEFVKKKNPNNKFGLKWIHGIYNIPQTDDEWGKLRKVVKAIGKSPAHFAWDINEINHAGDNRPGLTEDTLKDINKFIDFIKNVSEKDNDTFIITVTQNLTPKEIEILQKTNADIIGVTIYKRNGPSSRTFLKDLQEKLGPKALAKGLKPKAVIVTEFGAQTTDEKRADRAKDYPEVFFMGKDGEPAAVPVGIAFNATEEKWKSVQAGPSQFGFGIWGTKEEKVYQEAAGNFKLIKSAKDIGNPKVSTKPVEPVKPVEAEDVESGKFNEHYPALDGKTIKDLENNGQNFFGVYMNKIPKSGSDKILANKEFQLEFTEKVRSKLEGFRLELKDASSKIFSLFFQKKDGKWVAFIDDEDKGAIPVDYAFYDQAKGLAVIDMAEIKKVIKDANIAEVHIQTGKQQSDGVGRKEYFINPKGGVDVRGQVEFKALSPKTPTKLSKQPDEPKKPDPKPGPVGKNILEQGRQETFNQGKYRADYWAFPKGKVMLKKGQKLKVRLASDVEGKTIGIQVLKHGDELSLPNFLKKFKLKKGVNDFEIELEEDMDLMRIVFQTGSDIYGDTNVGEKIRLDLEKITVTTGELPKDGGKKPNMGGNPQGNKGNPKAPANLIAKKEMQTYSNNKAAPVAERANFYEFKKGELTVQRGDSVYLDVNVKVRNLRSLGVAVQVLMQGQKPDQAHFIQYGLLKKAGKNRLFVRPPAGEIARIVIHYGNSAYGKRLNVGMPINSDQLEINSITKKSALKRRGGRSSLDQESDTQVASAGSRGFWGIVMSLLSLALFAGVTSGTGSRSDGGKNDDTGNSKSKGNGNLAEEFKKYWHGDAASKDHRFDMYELRKEETPQTKVGSAKIDIKDTKVGTRFIADRILMELYVQLRKGHQNSKNDAAKRTILGKINQLRTIIIKKIETARDKGKKAKSSEQKTEVVDSSDEDKTIPVAPPVTTRPDSDPIIEAKAKTNNKIKLWFSLVGGLVVLLVVGALLWKFVIKDETTNPNGSGGPVVQQPKDKDQTPTKDAGKGKDKPKDKPTPKDDGSKKPVVPIVSDNPLSKVAFDIKIEDLKPAEGKVVADKHYDDKGEADPGEHYYGTFKNLNLGQTENFLKSDVIIVDKSRFEGELNGFQVEFRDQNSNAFLGVFVVEDKVFSVDDTGKIFPLPGAQYNKDSEKLYIATKLLREAIKGKDFAKPLGIHFASGQGKRVGGHLIPLNNRENRETSGKIDVRYANLKVPTAPPDKGMGGDPKPPVVPPVKPGPEKIAKPKISKWKDYTPERPTGGEGFNQALKLTEQGFSDRGYWTFTDKINAAVSRAMAGHKHFKVVFAPGTLENVNGFAVTFKGPANEEGFYVIFRKEKGRWQAFTINEAKDLEPVPYAVALGGTTQVALIDMVQVMRTFQANKVPQTITSVSVNSGVTYKGKSLGNRRIIKIKDGIRAIGTSSVLRDHQYLKLQAEKFIKEARDSGSLEAKSFKYNLFESRVVKEDEFGYVQKVTPGESKFILKQNTLRVGMTTALYAKRQGFAVEIKVVDKNPKNKDGKTAYRLFFKKQTPRIGRPTWVAYVKDEEGKRIPVDYATVQRSAGLYYGRVDLAPVIEAIKKAEGDDIVLHSIHVHVGPKRDGEDLGNKDLKELKELTVASALVEARTLTTQVRKRGPKPPVELVKPKDDGDKKPVEPAAGGPDIKTKSVFPAIVSNGHFGGGDSDFYSLSVSLETEQSKAILKEKFARVGIKPTSGKVDDLKEAVVRFGDGDKFFRVNVRKVDGKWTSVDKTGKAKAIPGVTFAASADTLFVTIETGKLTMAKITDVFVDTGKKFGLENRELNTENVPSQASIEAHSGKKADDAPKTGAKLDTTTGKRILLASASFGFLTFGLGADGLTFTGLVTLFLVLAGVALLATGVHYLFNIIAFSTYDNDDSTKGQGGIKTSLISILSVVLLLLGVQGISAEPVKQNKADVAAVSKVASASVSADQNEDQKDDQLKAGSPTPEAELAETVAAAFIQTLKAKANDLSANGQEQVAKAVNQALSTLPNQLGAASVNNDGASIVPSSFIGNGFDVDLFREELIARLKPIKDLGLDRNLILDTIFETLNPGVQSKEFKKAIGDAPSNSLSILTLADPVSLEDASMQEVEREINKQLVQDLIDSHLENTELNSVVTIPAGAMADEIQEMIQSQDKVVKGQNQLRGLTLVVDEGNKQIYKDGKLSLASLNTHLAEQLKKATLVEFYKRITLEYELDAETATILARALVNIVTDQLKAHQMELEKGVEFDALKEALIAIGA